MAAVGLIAIELRHEMAAWWVTLAEVGAGVGLAVIVASGRVLLAATALAPRAPGAAGDVCDDAGPLLPARLRERPRRLALWLSLAVALAITAVGVAQSDPFDGAMRGLLDGTACLVGLLALGPFLGLWPARGGRRARGRGSNLRRGRSPPRPLRPMPRPVRSAAAHAVGRRGAALMVALAAAVGVAACGGSGSSSSSSSSPPPSSSSSPPPTSSTSSAATTTTTVSASSSTTPQAVAGPPACRTGDLHLSLLSGNGAAGTSYTYYGLTNTGTNACSMIGYPGVSILDSNGRIVQHPATRGTGQSIPVRLVTLQPGQRARFLVNSTDVIPSPGCQHAYRGTTLQVFPPNQRDALLRPDNGPFCNLRVGPVQSAD